MNSQFMIPAISWFWKKNPKKIKNNQISFMFITLTYLLCIKNYICTFFSSNCKYLQCACYTNNFPQIELEVRMAGKILEKSQVWRVHFWLIDISEVSQKSWMKFNEQIVLLNWISVQSWLLALYKNNYVIRISGLLIDQLLFLNNHGRIFNQKLE